ncbi:MAG: prolyl oligopeptidase family serine peptidase [Pseudomonadota bacterium]
MSDLRDELAQLLGYADLEPHFGAVETVGREVSGNAEVLNLRFETFDGEVAPSWFVLPERRTGPVPAVLYLHAHGNRYDIGRQELFDGRRALQSAYCEKLIALGFAVLCVEMPCFGARQEPNESSRSKAHLWNGTTLFGRMLHELRCGMTFLCEHPEIDEKRIVTLGISMGGTQAYWLAAMDERIAAAVSLCSFADLRCLVKSGNHDKHGHYMSVPGLLKVASTGQIAGLVAPRPIFIGAGMKDWSSPPDCFDMARAELEQLYRHRSAQKSLRFHVEPDGGHEETSAVREAVLRFLRAMV